MLCSCVVEFLVDGVSDCQRVSLVFFTWLQQQSGAKVLALCWKLKTEISAILTLTLLLRLIFGEGISF